MIGKGVKYFVQEAKMTAKLSVNLNAIALLRNRRDLPWPSVTHLGRIALQAGADGLTVHPRPDQRHTRFSDLPELRALIDDEFPQAEFNVEGYPTEEFLSLVEDNQPEQVTLVPDDPTPHCRPEDCRPSRRVSGAALLTAADDSFESTVVLHVAAVDCHWH